MGLANKSVVLYESIKIGKKWKFCSVDEDSSRFPDVTQHHMALHGMTKESAWSRS
jgi:hypothetical protein